MQYTYNTPIIHFSIGAIANTCSFRHVRFGVMRAYAKNNQYYINHNLRRNNLTKSRADDLI